MQKRKGLPNQPNYHIEALTQLHKLAILQSRLIRQLNLSPHSRRLNSLLDLVLEEVAHNQRDLMKARSYTTRTRRRKTTKQPH